MAFPWDNLITAAAGVIGGVGGAGVTGYLANRREEAAADRVFDAAETDRQRDAYASLLVTAREHFATLSNCALPTGSKPQMTQNSTTQSGARALSSPSSAMLPQRSN